jgi:hypothetical protein
MPLSPIRRASAASWPEPNTPRRRLAAQPIACSYKIRMSMDNIENGQRINCNGVYGTVIGKRSNRNQHFVLVKMDNGFTLNLKADWRPARLSETSAIAQLIGSTKQRASVD